MHNTDKQWLSVKNCLKSGILKDWFADSIHEVVI